LYCRQKLGLVDGLSGRVFERSELSTTPSIKVHFWMKAISGAFFFGSFLLSRQKK
jgi:cbb3-type cytochrome oxidase subunit 1